MSSEVKNARAEGSGAGREGSVQDSERRTHAGNDAATRKAATPSIRDHDMRLYVDAGLQLIPLHRWNAVDQRGRPRGKTPRHGAWQARDYDSRRVIEDAKRNWTNVGVRLPADVMVLDVDPRNFGGKDDPQNLAGKDPLADLVRDCGLDLSLCPHTVTGSGGHHYWFRKPADITLLDTLPGYEGVEFKSAGRQVVAAGSIHPCGEYYEWDDLAPGLEDMPPMAESLLRLTRRPERAHGEAAGFGELTREMLAETLDPLDPADYSTQEIWLTLMMACHHATAGEGREEFIEWSTRDPDYADHAYIIGRRWDSLHADPSGGGRPVTIKFLYKVVQEAGFEVARPNPEDEFEVWEEEDADSGKRSRRFITIEELEALPPAQWLIPGIVTEASLAAVYGQPEAGKSFLAVDLAMSVAGGIPWHGRPVQKGGVLYIAAEGAPGLAKRVRAWKQDRAAVSHEFAFWLDDGDVNLAAEGAAVNHYLRQVAEELGSLKLIVVDTLNQTSAGADENSAKDMGRYITSLKRLRDQTGATVIVVHHSGKEATRGMRGSTAILGAMDTTVEVERDKDKRSITVSVKKQKDSEAEPPMRFGLERVVLPGEIDSTGKPPSSLVLRATLMAEPGADFEKVPAESTGLLALACELGAAIGTVKVADLVATAMKRLAVSDSSARREIGEQVPEGRPAALTAKWDGRVFRVWCERVGKHKTAPVVVRVEAA